MKKRGMASAVCMLLASGSILSTMPVSAETAEASAEAMITEAMTTEETSVMEQTETAELTEEEETDGEAAESEPIESDPTGSEPIETEPPESERRAERTESESVETDWPTEEEPSSAAETTETQEVRDNKNMEAMLGLLQEINEIPYLAFKETVVSEVDNMKLEITVSAMKRESEYANFNITIDFDIPEYQVSYHIEMEDLVRVLSDACYINIGEVLDTISELMGNGIVKRAAKMAGVTEPWIRIPYSSNLPVPREAVNQLIADIQQPLMECYMRYDAEKIDGGYQVTIDREKYLEVMNDMMNMAKDHLAVWIDDILDVLKAVNPQEFLVNEYWDAAVAGIREIAPEFDELRLNQMIDEAFDPEGYRAMLESIDGADFAEHVGPELDQALEEMRQLLEEEQTELNYLWAVTREENGGYRISSDQTMAVMGETASVSAEAYITPVDPLLVEAPWDTMELTELVHEMASSFYLMYYMGNTYAASEDITNESQSAWDESRELQTDGSRFLLESWDGGISCWISYDETVLSLDSECSSPDYVFLDFADGSNYVCLSINEYSDFNTVYQEKEEFNREYRGEGSMTEPQVSAADGMELMYTIGEYADDSGSSTKELIFGADLSEGCCVVGELMYLPGELTDDQALELAHQSIAGIELPDGMVPDETE